MHPNLIEEDSILKKCVIEIISFEKEKSATCIRSGKEKNVDMHLF